MDQHLIIYKEVVCKLEMSLQRDHVYPIMIKNARILMLNLYLCKIVKLTTRWNSRRWRQDLLSSGRQVNRSNHLIRVVLMPQVLRKQLNKICKTRSAGFVLALSKKVHQLKMANRINSFVHASVPVQWVWFISPVFANGSIANDSFTRVPKFNRSSGSR